MRAFLKSLLILLAKYFSNIGGQAVMEGVVIRALDNYVIALRRNSGEIHLYKAKWRGIHKNHFLSSKPFIRGAFILVESILNGVRALNYSVDFALDDDRSSVVDQGKSILKITTLATGFLVGLVLFILIPHFLTQALNESYLWGLDLEQLEFHLIDGFIKAIIFIFYLKFIGFIPEIKRVFQYHGAEHKAIATFEAGEELNVENAKKYSILHPRCGTSFVFFLLSFSIIFFSAIFSSIPIDSTLNSFQKHFMAIFIKLILFLPLAMVSYEVLNLCSLRQKWMICRLLNFPGMYLQRLTTRVPDEKQIEVALCSLKAALMLEDEQKGKSELDFELLDINDISELTQINKGDKKLIGEIKNVNV